MIEGCLKRLFALLERVAKEMSGNPTFLLCAPPAGGGTPGRLRQGYGALPSELPAEASAEAGGTATRANFKTRWPILRVDSFFQKRSNLSSAPATDVAGVELPPKEPSVISFRGFLLVFALAGAVIPFSAGAQVASYVDSGGVKHYSNRPDLIPEEYRQSAQPAELPQLGKITAGTYPTSAPRAPRETAAGSKKVRVLVTSWCTYCKALREFLEKKHVPYEEFDIEKSEQGRRLSARYGPGVPVTLIGKTVIHGYDPAKISAALGLQ